VTHLDPSPPSPQDATGALTGRGPNCWQCRFFGITHQPATPYACQRLGFRSQVLPSLEVLRTDGRFCQGFLPKSVAVPAPVGQTGTATPSPLSANTWSRFA
jgi:hypothetical protein